MNDRRWYRDAVFRQSLPAEENSADLPCAADSHSIRQCRAPRPARKYDGLQRRAQMHPVLDGLVEHLPARVDAGQRRRQNAEGPQARKARKRHAEVRVEKRLQRFLRGDR